MPRLDKGRDYCSGSVPASSPDPRKGGGVPHPVQTTYYITMELLTDGSSVSFQFPQTQMDPFARMCTLIPSARRHVYTSPRAVGHLLDLYERAAATKETYILFEGVPGDCLERLDVELRKKGLRRHARFTYEEDINSLIVRLLPSKGHEIVDATFFANLLQKISTLPGHGLRSVVTTGATRFAVPGGIRSKEGNATLAPASRRGDFMPSIAIEVCSLSLCPNTVPLDSNSFI